MSEYLQCDLVSGNELASVSVENDSMRWRADDWPTDSMPQLGSEIHGTGREFGTGLWMWRCVCGVTLGRSESGTNARYSKVALVASSLLKLDSCLHD